MKIKNVVKGILGLAVSASLVASCVSAEEITVFSDGYVSVGDSSNLLNEGDAVNVAVTKGGIDFLSYDEIGSITAENIEYYGVVSVDADNKYLIEFMPDETGEYTVFAGADVFDEARKYEVLYINKTNFLSAAEELLSCTTDEAFAEVLSTKSTELGLTDEIFDTADFAKVAPIARKSLDGAEVSDYEGIIEAAEKSALAALLNDEAVSDIGDYSELAGLDKNEYFSDDLADEVTDYVIGKDITDCAELDKLLAEGVIVANVNEKSASVISQVLKANADLLGINKSKITTALCSEIVKKNFSDIDALKDFIDSYKGSSGSGNPGGGSSGGGSAGGSSGGGNAYSGSAAYTPVTEDEVFELENPFTDMEGCEWAIDSVKQLYYKSIINGKEPGRFFPNDMVTREEFAKIITVAMKMNLVDEEAPFEDVDESAWYSSYVRTAYIAGITTGISDTLFGTGSNITREDLCVMVCRAVDAGDLSITAASGSEMSFYDAEEISDYAKESVQILYNAGIVNGSDGYFNPKAPATRAEAAKIVNMVILNIGL